MFDFEPEIEIPAEPYNGAVVFLAAMAYPERNAGRGKLGSKFANSLLNYLFWQARKHMGLPKLRAARNDPNFSAPQWAQFSGLMNQGLRRIWRRCTCYDLHNRHILATFVAAQKMGARAIAAGYPDEVYEMSPDRSQGAITVEVFKRAAVPYRAIIARDIEGWAENLGLNRTGRSADPAQKLKDLHKRAVLPSIPVLHMAHALNEAFCTSGPDIGGWEERDPILALLMNSNLWIDKAIDTAEKWRESPPHSVTSIIKPESMIRLRREKSPDNAPWMTGA